MVERIGIIVVVSLVMFFRTLRLKYVSDDVVVARTAPKPRNTWHRLILQLTGNGHYHPEEAHLLTTLLHTAVCVFIYLGLGKSDVSFLAALLFCVNPRNNQGSIWISGRVNYVIPTLMFVVSLSIPFVAPVALWFATRSATAFLTPIGFLGSSQWWLILIALGCWVVNLKYFKRQVKGKMEAESVNLDKEVSFKKLIIAVKTYGFYFFMCLVPDKLTFYHSFMQSAAGSGNELMKKRAYALDKIFWFGCLVLIGCPIYGLINGWNGVCWGVWWFSVSILPYLNIIRVQQEVAERYVYCANVGLMFALASVLINYPYLAVVFLSVYAVRLFYLIPAYRDDYWIKENCVREDPLCWFAWHMRAVHRWEIGSRHEALTNWVMAKLISPQEFKIWANLASVMRVIGKVKDSDACIAEARKCIIKGQEEESEKILRDIKSNKNAKPPFLT